MEEKVLHTIEQLIRERQSQGKRLISYRDLYGLGVSPSDWMQYYKNNSTLFRTYRFDDPFFILAYKTPTKIPTDHTDYNLNGSTRTYEIFDRNIPPTKPARLPDDDAQHLINYKRSSRIKSASYGYMKRITKQPR